MFVYLSFIFDLLKASTIIESLTRNNASSISDNQIQSHNFKKDKNNTIYYTQLELEHFRHGFLQIILAIENFSKKKNDNDFLIPILEETKNIVKDMVICRHFEKKNLYQPMYIFKNSGCINLVCKNNGCLNITGDNFQNNNFCSKSDAILPNEPSQTLENNTDAVVEKHTKNFIVIDLLYDILHKYTFYRNQEHQILCENMNHINFYVKILKLQKNVSIDNPCIHILKKGISDLNDISPNNQDKISLLPKNVFLYDIIKFKNLNFDSNTQLKFDISIKKNSEIRKFLSYISKISNAIAAMNLITKIKFTQIENLSLYIKESYSRKIIRLKNDLAEIQNIILNSPMSLFFRLFFIYDVEKRTLLENINISTNKSLFMAKYSELETILNSKNTEFLFAWNTKILKLIKKIERESNYMSTEPDSQNNHKNFPFENLNIMLSEKILWKVLFAEKIENETYNSLSQLNDNVFTQNDLSYFLCEITEIFEKSPSVICFTEKIKDLSRVLKEKLSISYEMNIDTLFKNIFRRLENMIEKLKIANEPDDILVFDIYFCSRIYKNLVYFLTKIDKKFVEIMNECCINYKTIYFNPFNFDISEIKLDLSENPIFSEYFKKESIKLIKNLIETCVPNLCPLCEFKLDDSFLHFQPACIENTVPIQLQMSIAEFLLLYKDTTNDFQAIISFENLDFIDEEFGSKIYVLIEWKNSQKKEDFDLEMCCLCKEFFIFLSKIPKEQGVNIHIGLKNVIFDSCGLKGVKRLFFYDPSPSPCPKQNCLLVNYIRTQLRVLLKTELLQMIQKNIE